MPERAAFAPQYASVPHRDNTAELGMWVFIATEVLLFGGLILAYFVYRHAFLQGFAEGSRHTDIVIGTTNTAVLLTSSFLVAWAVEVFSPDTARLSAWLLTGAACLGLFFIVLKGIEYSKEYDEHLVPGVDFQFAGPLANGVQLFFIFYFVATAIHALHMLIGICLLTTLAAICRKAPTARHHTALHSAALYWHFVDVVWIFLFALIYLPGRSSS
ncbi:cytochrome c oxidase subunit 3 [Bradyrhizobium sp.]|uniref:cytochrome c oxidase subunit 3 n=1 Tax=Bradyrhizobium sp. TaxID=376 RepID=UPI001DA1787B|nr:cytochrome c oxidase subunit 3 [Bradyrhizobium sp.]MBV8699904.1 cytochrome c oxidase subunit 3 [Bradyrhizobium sp.]MBV8921144.1 cytochrome c oxidase subunit 3 [Bradyrhizobium sp.]MBV9985880.1 cytochrome c oxidase subunit 3 [Bradyrhizobium sp.]